MSDAVLEKEYVYHKPLLNVLLIFFRKDKPTGQIFGSGFSWSEALDAVADIYNGVSSTLRGVLVEAMLIDSQFVFWSMLTSLGLTVWCKSTSLQSFKIAIADGS